MIAPSANIYVRDKPSQGLDVDEIECGALPDVGCTILVGSHLPHFLVLAYPACFATKPHSSPSQALTFRQNKDADFPFTVSFFQSYLFFVCLIIALIDK